MDENYEQEVDLWNYLEVPKKHWLFILGISVVVTVISVIISLRLPKTYEAEAILRIGRAGDRTLEPIGATQEIITSIPTLKQIAKGVEKEPSKEVIGRIKKKIDIRESSGLLIVKTIDKTPKDAEKLGQIICDIILERHKHIYRKAEKDLHNYLTQVKVQMRSLQRIIEFREFSNAPTIIEIPPTASDIPVSPKKRRIISITFILSLMCSVFLSFILEGIQKRKKV